MRSLRTVWFMPLFAALPVVSTGCIPASEKHLPVASSVKPYRRLPACLQEGGCATALLACRQDGCGTAFGYSAGSTGVVTMILLLYLGGGK